MKTPRRLLGFFALVSLTSACEIFEDQRPELVSFRMDGTPGDEVMVIYSKQFVAGVDETGVTRVEVIRSDTVTHVLPFDTILDIRLERQILLQAEVLPTDTLDVDVLIEVDDRSIYDQSGKLFPNLPWRFLYRFNQRFTDVIEVVI